MAQTIPPEKLERVRGLLEGHRWIFAKTMPQNPHHYTLRREWDRETEFVEAVEFIRQNGEREIFQGRRYTVLVIDSWKYWTMGAPLDQTILINRAAILGR